MNNFGRPEGLECSHCGGIAIDFHPPAHERDYWHLFDEEGERCAECGFPGAVRVTDRGDDEGNPCSWLTADYDDEARCRRPECEACRAMDAERGVPPAIRALSAAPPSVQCVEVETLERVKNEARSFFEEHGCKNGCAPDDMTCDTQRFRAALAELVRP